MRKLTPTEQTRLRRLRRRLGIAHLGVDVPEDAADEFREMARARVDEHRANDLQAAIDRSDKQAVKTVLRAWEDYDDLTPGQREE